MKIRTQSLFATILGLWILALAHTTISNAASLTQTNESTDILDMTITF